MGYGTSTCLKGTPSPNLRLWVERRRTGGAGVGECVGYLGAFLALASVPVVLGVGIGHIIWERGRCGSCGHQALPRDGLCSYCLRPPVAHE